MINNKRILFFPIMLLLAFNSIIALSIDQNEDPITEIDKEVLQAMKKGGVPGLNVVIVNKGQTILKNYGYKNLNLNEFVDNNTLFEIGSCSKAFTALAILKLQNDNKLSLVNKVSDYLPWFKVYYKGKKPEILIYQLLQHTSGIPWYTISLIPQNNNSEALEQTIKKINGITLHENPGEQFEYATVNYDILALIIEKITGQSFESYMEDVVLKDLKLNNTYIGKQEKKTNMSKGYKISFFKPRMYDAPTFKGNNAAGYVVTNAEDIARWLKYQMDLLPCPYDSLILKSHKRDKSVMPNNLSSYAFGWFVSLKGDNEIYHSGLNPNFTSYIAFRKKEGIGVAVLANSNSPYTEVIGKNIMKILAGEKVTANFNPDDQNDKAFSVVSIILGIYLLIVLSFICYIVYGILKGKRAYEPFTLKKMGYVISVIFILIPFLYGIYLLPKAMAGFTWESALVWMPVSFPVAVVLCVSSIALSYIAYVVSLLFPEKNEYLREAPGIIILSILSGLSNMLVILLITSSLKNNMELKFMLYYFGLTMGVYLLGRKIVQTKMIYITRNIIYDLRMKLINKVFSTSYEKFEKIDRGRVYSTMNDDIGTIGQSANTFVNITTSIITAGGAFIYMAALAFWATLITVLLVGSISTVYYIVSRKTRVLFDDARETRTVYMRLLNGMIDGFKELSIHRKKKIEFRNDIESTTDEYRRKIRTAEVKFVNAFLVGESLLIALLATVAFAVPRIFVNVQFYTVMSFIIILLYLIGPVNAVLGSIPQLMQLRIAWERVQSFIRDIPANLKLSEVIKETVFNDKVIYSIKVKSLLYRYYGTDSKNGFSVGPVDLEVRRGEALFVVGGNGSGKTTLAKLITGLYSPQSGGLFINNKKVKQHEIGEYFSAVFSPFHLFQKLYNIDMSDVSKKQGLDEFLKTLRLDKKVTVENNEYSTINLSGGQRKRLALLQCYLEDKPIYLFDEWAADQDPGYRKFFYRELITNMKKQGKIIIAITHDDHYFDVADKILKLDMGKVEYYKSSQEVDKGAFTGT
jgi:putative pyoverdin transport system ATP-binding/permease protein